MSMLKTLMDGEFASKSDFLKYSYLPIWRGRGSVINPKGPFLKNAFQFLS